VAAAVALVELRVGNAADRPYPRVGSAVEAALFKFGCSLYGLLRADYSGALVYNSAPNAVA
jgi:hypothetical protein